MTHSTSTDAPLTRRVRGLETSNEVLRRELQTALGYPRRAFVYGAVIFGVIGFMAGAAFAGDTASWDGTGCTLVPIEGQDHVAEVRCTNVETRGDSFTIGDMGIEGLSVHLTILHGPGGIPDYFTITPGPGFIALPPDMSLNENARGVAKIMPWIGG